MLLIQLNVPSWHLPMTTHFMISDSVSSKVYVLFFSFVINYLFDLYLILIMIFLFQPMIRLYDIPDNTFESENEDVDDEEAGNALPF